MEPKSLEGTVTLKAACAEHNHNQNPLLNSLRRILKNGDYDFAMEAVPKSKKTWVEFTREFDEEKHKFNTYGAMDHNLFIGRSPADVFWKITNYGSLRWKWSGIGAQYWEEKLKADARPHNISHLNSRVVREMDEYTAEKQLFRRIFPDYTSALLSKGGNTALGCLLTRSTTTRYFISRHEVLSRRYSIGFNLI